MMLRFSTMLLLLLALPSPAVAGSSAWQEVAPGTRARLISDDIVVAGHTRVGLELELPAGSVTYWRIAGETGIPTELDFAASQHVTHAAVNWPFPEVESKGGYRNYVYRGDVVLPVDLSVSGPEALLDVHATLGICSDLCMPAEIHLTQPLTFAAPDRAQSLRLDVATRDVPLAWDQPTPAVATVRAVANGLEVSGLDAAIDGQSLIADVGLPGVLFGAPQKSPDTDLWMLPLLGQEGQGTLGGRALELTFMTQQGPYTTTLQIAPTR